MIKKIKKILYRSFDSKEISYKKLQEMRKNNLNSILLDVRSKQEYEEGHLEGSINIPLYDLDNHIDEIPDKKCIIIIYCASGHRSRQAKEKLENMGYENVYNLKDGLEGM